MFLCRTGHDSVKTILEKFALYELKQTKCIEVITQSLGCTWLTQLVSLRLSEFKSDVAHRPGVKHKLADPQD